ncbi:hypothetical protein ACH5RR_029834 [Cinchona calisaya]|uniref:DDE Tnp4 domain-containing protein n=1 Tax=Cinchona calisaya TaxID=153742 RepID=A0ABD2YSY6_9GENT
MSMNSDNENAMVIGSSTSVLAMGYAILEFYKTHEAIPKAPHVNKDKDKYYLLDAGYGICNGFIPPYHGVRCHLKESDDNPPKNEKELFNLHHFSLHTTIEQGFSVLKKRFHVLDNDPFWKYKTQVDVKNPTHDKYINKKIDMYNEITLVVGKDLATESFAKGFTNVMLEAPITLDDVMNNTEEVPLEKDIPTSVASTSGTKQHRKRSRSNDEIEKISEKLGEVAATLTKLSDIQLIVSYLYNQLKMKGYDDEFLTAVFNHLVQNEILVIAFMAKSEKLHRISIDNFKKENDLAFCA